MLHTGKLVYNARHKKTHHNLGHDTSLCFDMNFHPFYEPPAFTTRLIDVFGVGFGGTGRIHSKWAKDMVENHYKDMGIIRRWQEVTYNRCSARHHAHG